MKNRWRTILVVTTVAVVAVGTIDQLIRATRTRVPAVSIDLGGQILNEWLVVGPFEGGAVFDEDFLIGYRGAESAASAADFERAARALHHRFEVRDPRAPRSLCIKNDFPDFQSLFNRGYDTDPKPQHVAYAACKLVAKASAVVHLSLGSQDGLKVWLNGRHLHGSQNQRKINTYDDSVALPLVAGENLLLVKVTRVGGGVTNSWGFSARFDTTEQQATRNALAAHDTLDSWLLESSIVKPGGPLRLNIRGAPSNAVVNVKLKQRSGRIVVDSNAENKGNVIPGSAELIPGFYEAIVSIGNGETFHETFLVGTPEEVRSRAESRFRGLRLSDRDSLHMEAIARRMDILLKPENRPSKGWNTVREWERKLLFTVLAGEDFLDRAESGEPATRGVAGLHIRAFRSRIDDQPKHYRIYVPSTYSASSPPLPLVVFLPTPITVKRPFIESPSMAGHESAERISRMAESLGLGIVWCGYRTPPTGGPALGEFTHLDEVLESIALDYRLDAARLYLFGICGAATTASMMAVHWPERFAALGLIHPEIRCNLRAGDGMESILFAAKAKWWSTMEPLAQLSTNKTLPTLALWDGSPAGHGDIGNCHELVSAGKTGGLPVTFRTRTHTEWERMGTFEELLRWFSSHHRTQASSKPAGPTAQRLGPVASAVAARFTLVLGSQGTETEVQGINEAGEKFGSVWKQKHFSPCRSVVDTKLAVADFEESNLVVIGTIASSALLQKYAEGLGLRVEKDGVTIRGQTYKGGSLAVQAVFRHPVNSQRKLVVITAQRAESLPFLPMNLDEAGFDLAIWRVDNGYARPIFAE